MHRCSAVATATEMKGEAGSGGGFPDYHGHGGERRRLDANVAPFGHMTTQNQLSRFASLYQ